MDHAGGLEGHDELRGLRVEPALLRCRHGVVDRVAEQLVAEVEVALVDVVEREDERGLHELLDRGLDVLQRAIDHPRDHVGAEAAAEHGAGPGECSRVG
jgi:hypothetical protein